MAVQAIKVFYCYAHEDDALREQLDRHLSPLRRVRYITAWFDRDIQAGTDWEREIETHLDTAGIILLLISADFIASDYCYGSEMQRALEKHRAGTAYVIPIILRPVAWEETRIGELSVLPKSKKPVTQWANQDEAWLDVVNGIREVVKTLLPKQILSLQETSILYPEQIGQSMGGVSFQPKQVFLSHVANASLLPTSDNASEILRRIHHKDISASWRVIYPTWKDLLEYYSTFFVLLVVPCPFLFFAAVSAGQTGLSILSLIFGGLMLILIMLLWKESSNNVLVLTPDRLLWGNWQDQRRQKVFCFQDYAALNVYKGKILATKTVRKRSGETKMKREKISVPRIFGYSTVWIIANAHKQFLQRHSDRI